MKLWSDKKRQDLIDLAKSGDVKAQIYLGNAFILGDHLAKDEKQAVFWLESAEAQGSDVASFRLAFFQVHKRNREGLDRLLSLRDRGFSAADYELGNCYYRGTLLDRDELRGVGAWKSASNKGHILAKMKINKYKQEKSILALKPIFLAKAIFWAVTAMFVIAKDADDPRILGHLA